MKKLFLLFTAIGLYQLGYNQCITDQIVSAHQSSFLCHGETMIDVTGTDSDVLYFLRDDATNEIMDGPVQGTGASIMFGTGELNTTQTFHVYGMKGNALDFDGVDDYVSLPADPSLDFTGDFTVECIYQKTTSAFGSLYSQWEGGTNQKRIELHITGTNQVRLLVSDDGFTNTYMVTADDPISLNEWSHVAAVFEAGVGGKIYINGELASSTETGPVPTSVFATSSVTSLGNSRQGTNNLFAGFIDEIKVWDIAKSDSDIESGILSMLSGTEPNLAAYWNFEDGSGTVVSDKTINTNNATMFNMDPSTDWVTGIMGSCELVMTDKPTITIDQISDETVVPFTNSICPTNTGVSMEIVSSQVGVEYTLRDNFDNSPVDGPHTGTGSAVDFNTGTLLSSKDFNVLAEVITTSGALDNNGINGAPEYVQTSTYPMDSWNTFTIEFWVKQHITVSPYSLIFGRNFGNTQLWLQSDGRVVMRDKDNTNYMTVAGVFPYNDGNWHHVAVSWDNVTLTGAFYVDGVSVPLDPTANSFEGFDSGGRLQIGSHVNYYACEATLDDFRIWSVARSAFDIQDNFDKEINVTESNLEAYYMFEDGPGSTVAVDATGNGWDANLVNIDPVADWIDRSSIKCSMVMTDIVNIAVEDIISPVPDSSSLMTISGDCSVNAPASPTATDNCSGAIVGVSDVTFPVTDQGTTVVTWTFEDDLGNTSTQTQNIVIADVDAPVPDSASLLDINSECPITPAAPTATDNCSGDLVGVPDVSFPISDQGTTVVTWTFEDDEGNISQQTQNVMLADVTNPTIVAPSDIVVSTNSSDCTATIASLGSETAADNCVVSSVANDAPVVFPVGTTVVTWTVEDEAGNTAIATQNVTVENNMNAGLATSADPSGCNVSDGFIDIDVSGGSGPYTFDWNSGEFLFEDLVGVSAGSYTAIITDTNGCTTSITVGLNDPDAPVVTVDNTIEPVCNGSNDGSIEISVSGGLGPYQFDWSNDEPGDYDDDEDPESLPSGSISVVVMDANGCSATETIIIDEPDPISFEQSVTICAEETLDVGTNIYSESGIYTDVLVNNLGCDSTVTTNLTVMPVLIATQKLAICYGETVTVGTSVYSESGTYSDVFESVLGCDSTVTTTLIVSDPINVNVSDNMGTLVADQAGAEYQWMICDNGFAIIPGETSQEFSPTVSGDYAVQITVGNCSDISDCIRMGTVGVTENGWDHDLDVYPIPTFGEVTIDLGKVFDNVTVDLKNMLGQNVKTQHYRSAEIINFEIEGETGYYLLEIRTSSGQLAVIKVLKE